MSVLTDPYWINLQRESFQLLKAATNFEKNKIPPQTSLEYFFTSQRGQDLKYLDDIKNKMVKKAK